MQFEWLLTLVQSEWRIAIPATFGLGFLMGYLVRAMVSRRRRRQARLAREGWRGNEQEAHHWRLQGPPAPSISPDMDSKSLGGWADTPGDHVRDHERSKDWAGRGLR
jgi:hypothetical protein